MATRFEGTDTYIATEDLRVAVNAAVALERPLLVKGEPGTGKTILAHEIAKALGKDIITWHIKSTTKAQQGLYEYDAVTRLRDGQLGDAKVAALGRSVNATIKDKYYGAAAAQPRKVFRMLESGSSNHLSKVGKQKPGLKVNLEKAVGAIMEGMSPGQDPFPASLPDRSQALFGLGYYHQRNEFFRKAEKLAPVETDR